uniref:Uncharacterized protein n=1 Tax=Oryza nivara TaxID=4536 RepID=A0A0E0FV41_ORYNI
MTKEDRNGRLAACIGTRKRGGGVDRHQEARLTASGEGKSRRTGLPDGSDDGLKVWSPCDALGK